MPHLTTYPNCASSEVWSTCSNNCIGTKKIPCVDCIAKSGDPCGIKASGIGCVPKTCVSSCCQTTTKLSKYELLSIGVL